jgi:hypothetical protein
MVGQSRLVILDVASHLVLLHFALGFLEVSYVLEFGLQRNILAIVEINLGHGLVVYLILIKWQVLLFREDS